MPSTGRLAIEFMQCVNRGSKKCSPMQWFTYMGNVEVNQIPFQINYIPQPAGDIVVDGKMPLDPMTVPCSKSVDVSS